MTQQLSANAVASEALPLAAEMAGALDRFVALQMEHFGVTATEARESLDSSLEWRYEMMHKHDLTSVTFFELASIMKADPELARQKLAELRAAARAELQTGHTAAQATEASLPMSSWPRMRFLALRDELASAWNPQNGIERTLIDMLAQAWTAQLFWHERMMLFSCLEGDNQQIKHKQKYPPPRIDDAKAVAQAAEMVDQFNRIFMRTLRMLKDLRQHSPTLVVQNARQVNVAESQINLG